MPKSNNKNQVTRSAAKDSSCSNQGSKWMGSTHGNAILRLAIPAIWHSQASKSTFFRGNASSQAGKIVLSTETQLVNLNLVKIQILA